ncbi:MAG TPA: hypothetical protein VNT79_14470 [Phycisphaerae bacterium]|nr:hypothetical protein [Phycisphaerae bacterium]
MNSLKRRRRFYVKYATLSALTLGTCWQFGCIQAILATIGVTFF